MLISSSMTFLYYVSNTSGSGSMLIFLNLFLMLYITFVINKLAINLILITMLCMKLYFIVCLNVS